MQADHPELVKMLIKAGADVHALNSLGLTAFVFGAWFTSTSAMRAFLELVPDWDVNHGIVTPLSALVCPQTFSPVSDLDALEMLLERGALLNQTDCCGFTPLTRAAGHHCIRPEVIELLIKYGADVNMPAIFAEGPKSMAGVMPRLRAALGMKPDNIWYEWWSSLEGATPLHTAARWGTLESMATLLKHGASPHAVDGQGLTPLDAAQARGETAALCFQELVDFGEPLMCI